METSHLRIPAPEDPYLRVVVQIAKLDTRCALEIYLKPHQSLLEIQKVACNIYKDLLQLLPTIEDAFGCGLEETPANEDQVVQQHVVALRRLIVLEFFVALEASTNPLSQTTITWFS